MAIKYLDAKRIQGSSTGANTTVTITDAGGEEDAIRNGDVTIAGQRFQTGHTLIGKTIKSFTVYLKKQGSPTGNLEAKIINSSNTEKASFGTLDVSTLTTSFVQKTFTFVSATTNNIIDADDRISLHYSGGSSGNATRVELCSSCDIDYTNEGYYISSWAERTGSMRMTVTYGSSEKATLVTSTTSSYGNANFTNTSGQDQYVKIGTSPATSFGTGDFTIAFWIKSANFGSGAPCFMGTYSVGGGSSSGDHWQFYEVGGAIKLSDGSTTITTPITSIEDDEWHHIALTRSGTSVTSYKDGSVAGTAQTYAVDFPAPSTYLAFAQRGDNAMWCTMKMQDLGFWSREVSASDIATLATGKPIDSLTGYATDLEGYYKFNGNFDDSSDNERDATTVDQATTSSTGGKFDTNTINSSDLEENTLFEETDTRGVYWLQDNEWKASSWMFAGQTTPIWGTKAYWWQNGTTDKITESAMPVTTNAVAKANSTVSTGGENTNFPTFTKLYSLGGNTINNIQEYTMGTTTASTDKADLRYAVGRCRAKAYDGTYGYQMGGFANPSTAYKEIQSYTIGTTTTAIDKADLNRDTCNQAGGVYGKTYAYSVEGFSGSSNFVDIQEYAMGTTTTAVDKADGVAKRDISSIQNTTDIWTGDGTSNGITQYTMNTGTNATNHGNMSTHIQSYGSANSKTYGYWAEASGIYEYQMGSGTTITDKGDMTNGGSCPASGQGSP